jgi:hypothetical protein
MNDSALKHNLTNRSTWLRGLYMLLFALIYKVAEIVLFAVALFQFGSRLFTGETHERVRVFGESLSIFNLQVWLFLTFNSEILPFPFGPWPDEHTCRRVTHSL